jgi:hypothetical protein
MPSPHVKSAFQTVKSHNTLSNRQIVTLVLVQGLTNPVYLYVPNEFVIGQVVLKSVIKGLTVAMVNKTVA